MILSVVSMLFFFCVCWIEYFSVLCQFVSILFCFVSVCFNTFPGKKTTMMSTRNFYNAMTPGSHLGEEVKVETEKIK